MIRIGLGCAGVILTFFMAANDGGCTSNRSSGGNGIPPGMTASSEEKYRRLRERMVREQLEGRDIKDERVLAVMREVPRHRFVPPDFVDSSYEDNALPLILGQTISQPYIVAYMTQALELTGKERVLEVGTGSGYQAAVLAELAAEVFTIEIEPELARQAESVLRSLGYRNIHVRVGDGYDGWPESAPFDRVMVTAAPDHVPQQLLEQLKPGGKMIIPVGRTDQELLLIEKTASGVTTRSKIPVRFVPMTGKAQRRPRE